MVTTHPYVPSDSYNLNVEIVYHDADSPILQSSVKGSVTGVYQ